MFHPYYERKGYSRSAQEGFNAQHHRISNLFALTFSLLLKKLTEMIAVSNLYSRIIILMSTVSNYVNFWRFVIRLNFDSPNQIKLNRLNGKLSIQIVSTLFRDLSDCWRSLWTRGRISSSLCSSSVFSSSRPSRCSPCLT